MKDQKKAKQIDIDYASINDDEFQTSIPDEICFDTTPPQNFDNTGPDHLQNIKRNNSTLLNQNHNSNSDTLPHPKLQNDQKPNNLSQRMQRTTPINLMYLFNKAQKLDMNTQLLRDENDIYYSKLLSSSKVQNKSQPRLNAHNEIKRTNIAKNVNQRNSQNDRVNNGAQIERLKVNFKKISQERLHNKSPFLVDKSIENTNAQTVREQKNENSKLQKIVYHRKNETMTDLSFRHQSQRQLDQNSQGINNLKENTKIQKQSNRKKQMSFSGIPRDMIDHVKLKQQELQISQKEVLPLEIRLLKQQPSNNQLNQDKSKEQQAFQRSISQNKSTQGNEQSISTLQATPNRIQYKDGLIQKPQRSKSRNIVERYLKQSQSSLSIQLSQNNPFLTQSLKNLQTNQNQAKMLNQSSFDCFGSSGNQSFGGIVIKDLKVDLRSEEDLEENYMQTQGININIQSEFDDTTEINDCDFDENRALMISPQAKTQYSPDKYYQDMRRSPSKIFDHSQNNGGLTKNTSRTSIVVFEASSQEKQNKKPNQYENNHNIMNNDNQTKVYKRDKGKAKQQSHSDYISLMNKYD